MATILQASTGTATTVTSTNRYSSVGNCNTLSDVTTENNVKVIQRTAGTYSNLYIRITANSLSSSCTFTFRKNGVNGNQAITIPSSTTGAFQDTSNSDSVVAGDLVSCLLATTAGGTSITASIRSCLFAATSNTNSRMLTGGQVPFSGPATTYTTIVGAATHTATESTTQIITRTAATVKNFFVYCSSNARTNTTTIGTRLNTANGNCSVSIPAATTGLFEDTSNSDTLVSGDKPNYYITIGSGIAIMILSQIGCDFTTTNSKTMFVTGAVVTSPSAGTVYTHITGQCFLITTELDTRCKANGAFRISNLQTNVSSNTSTSTNVVIRLRKNGANGNSVLTLPLSTDGSPTGFKEDAVNTDTIVSTDELNFSIVGPSAGALTYTSIWALADYSSPNHNLSLLGVGT